MDGKRVAAQVAELRGWLEDDPGERFLDRAWQAFADLTSAAHHREGRVIGPDESRAGLVLAASLLEYIGDSATGSAR